MKSLIIFLCALSVAGALTSGYFYKSFLQTRSAQTKAAEAARQETQVVQGKLDHLLTQQAEREKRVAGIDQELAQAKTRSTETQNINVELLRQLSQMRNQLAEFQAGAPGATAAEVASAAAAQATMPSALEEALRQELMNLQQQFSAAQTQLREQAQALAAAAATPNATAAASAAAAPASSASSSASAATAYAPVAADSTPGVNAAAADVTASSAATSPAASATAAPGELVYAYRTIDALKARVKELEFAATLTPRNREPSITAVAAVTPSSQLAAREPVAPPSPPVAARIAATATAPSPTRTTPASTATPVPVRTVAPSPAAATAAATAPALTAAATPRASVAPAPAPARMTRSAPPPPPPREPGSAEVMTVGTGQAFVVLHFFPPVSVQLGQRYQLSRRGVRLAVVEVSTVEGDLAIAQIQPDSLLGTLSVGDRALPLP